MYIPGEVATGSYNTNVRGIFCLPGTTCTNHPNVAADSPKNYFHYHESFPGTIFMMVGIPSMILDCDKQLAYNSSRVPHG